MNNRCEKCEFTYEREPGYFLGSSYINYGWTAISMTVAYVFFHFTLGLPNYYVMPPLVTYSVVFPIFFHRYARALWLAFDCYFDHTEFTDPAETESQHEALPTDGCTSCGKSREA